jgi:hypothetical protein
MSNFSTNGFTKIKKFINEDFIHDLNFELDEIFKFATINYSNGYIRISNFTKGVPFPFIYIKSTNLMEFVIDVAECIQNQGVDLNKLTLSDIQIFSEIGDTQELAWHTDHSAGGILAIVYLRGGGKKSGGALFMKDTHLSEHDLNLHHLDKESIEKRSNLITDLSGDVGDMVLYHVNGFHSRHPLLSERRVIRLTFLPKIKHSVKSFSYDDFVFPLSSLTPRVSSYLPTLFKSYNESPTFTEINGGVSEYIAYPRYVGFYNLLHHFIHYNMQRVRRKLKRFW